MRRASGGESFPFCNVPWMACASTCSGHVVDDLTLFGDDDGGSGSDSSEEEEADQMMENVDAVYQRLKALKKNDGSASASANTTKLEYTGNASTHTIDEEDDDSGDGFLVNDDSNFIRRPN